MSRLVLTSQFLAELRGNLLKHDLETCAVLYGRAIQVDGKLARITVRESVHPDASVYSHRTSTRVQLRPEFVAEVVHRARRNRDSVIFVHTHPFPLNAFSSIDDAGEAELAEFLHRRIPGISHASMLLTPNKSLAREIGTDRLLQVTGIGEKIVLNETFDSLESSNCYDRQVRAFGKIGQKSLESIRVGIVGVGGTGSAVLQQLVYLGVRNFVLIDPDTVEESNLNRLFGATPADVGRPKVTVAEEWARRINPTLEIDARQDSVLKNPVMRSLADTDFVFACTDSHGSRAIINQFAYQYLVPTIDMGVVIAAPEGRVTHVAGRTQLLAPGLACLTCGNLLDAEEVRRDMMTDFERQADPYILGDPEPAPAVISLNSTISSLAVTMFLNTMVGIPGNARFLNYNAMTGICRPAICNPHPSCIVCSHRGALARGDEWPLPGRPS